MPERRKKEDLECGTDPLPPGHGWKSASTYSHHAPVTKQRVAMTSRSHASPLPQGDTLKLSLDNNAMRSVQG